MKKTLTAGGVVIGPHKKVVVVNQNGLSWSLPKGHVEPGETPRQTADREIKEETGISQLEFVKELGEYDRFKISLNGNEDKSELKHIVMFVYRTSQTQLQPEDPDNPEARWVAVDKVSDLLTHPKDKAFFRQIQEQLFT